MKLITLAAALAITSLSCQKHKNDDAQPSPNKVEENAKGEEAPSTPSTATPSTPSTSSEAPKTPEVVVQAHKQEDYVAFVSANYASASPEDQSKLIAVLSESDKASPSQDLSVFKAKLDQIIAGRALIRDFMARKSVPAEYREELLLQFETWSINHGAVGQSPYTEQNFITFLDEQEV